MDIVRFTAGASAEALAPITDGDRVVELGAASVPRLLASPRWRSQRLKVVARSWSSVT
jgi:hypothetical protein